MWGWPSQTIVSTIWHTRWKVEKQTIILHLQKPTAPFSPLNCSRFKWYVRITSHLCLPYHFYLVMMLIVNSKSEGSIVWCGQIDSLKVQETHESIDCILKSLRLWSVVTVMLTLWLSQKPESSLLMNIDKDMFNTCGSTCCVGASEMMALWYEHARVRVLCSTNWLSRRREDWVLECIALNMLRQLLWQWVGLVEVHV